MSNVHNPNLISDHFQKMYYYFFKYNFFFLNLINGCIYDVIKKKIVLYLCIMC